jgi:SAM-dependent methyltransferase
MNTEQKVTAKEAQAMADAAELKSRLQPSPGERFYLHLSDLRRMMQELIPLISGRVLDYGCGGSPYRPLFKHDAYVRADVGGMTDLDHVIVPGQPLDAPNTSFDCILSTQVLEHVSAPLQYLADCHRMLKDSGTLLLSTHGTFPDHSVPWDFQRWTTIGLRRDIEAAGFRVEKIWKLTSGPRAVLQLLELNIDRIPGGGLPFGLVFRVLRGLWRKMTPAFHRWADLRTGSFRLVEDSDHQHHRLYLGIMVHARKVAG